MKIAIIVTARVTAETFVKGFAQFAASRGHNVSVIADNVEPTLEQIETGTVKFVPVVMKRDPAPSSDIRSLFRLIRVIREIAPQVVLYATPKASMLGSIAAAINRIPTRIYQLWGLRLETVNGPARLVLGAFELLTSTLSSSIVANSHSLAQRYKELHLNGFTKIVTLGSGSSHGVDLQYFTPQQNSTITQTANNSERTSFKPPLRLGFVGRLHPDKGIDTLIEAMEILTKRSCSVSVLIVGNNEGLEYPMSGEARIAIDFVGFTKDPRPFYQQMDVLVLPSLREGFPNVVLEAAAMGIPAIVSDGTGVIDSVVNRETGLVFPVRNASALADTIEFLLNNPEELIRMGRNARFRAEKFFDQEIVWESLLSHIQKIAKF